MTQFAANSVRLGKAERHVDGNGRAWWVAPAASIIGDGVLNGSKGALHYPAQHVEASTPHWDGKPITLRHPTDPISGAHLSAAEAPNQHLGVVKDTVYNGKLRHKMWFSEEALESRAPNILYNLKAGIPLELSTGLYTENDAGAGKNKAGKSYTHTAKNYRPDHIAVLPDEVGACSLNDGCGVGVINKRVAELVTNEERHVLLGNFNPNHDDKGKFDETDSADTSGKYDHMAHLLYGQSIHSVGHSKKEAMAKAKELRSKGIFAGAFSDDKAPKGKNYIVTVPESKRNPKIHPTGNVWVGNVWSDEARQASIEARKSGKAADHLKAAKLHLRDSRDSGDDSHKAAVQHIAQASKMVKNKDKVNNVTTEERVSLWRRIGVMLGLAKPGVTKPIRNKGFTDDAAAKIEGTRKTPKETHALGDVDEDDDQETVEAGNPHDSENPPGVGRGKAIIDNKERCPECGGEMDEDGECEECGYVENAFAKKKDQSSTDPDDDDDDDDDVTENCPKCKGKMTDNKCSCGGTMNLQTIINRLTPLSFVKIDDPKFLQFVTNMPAGGAFSGAKEAGYSAAQAAAMAGKLEGSYEGGAGESHGKASAAAEKASAHADKTKSKSAHKKAAAAHKEASTEWGKMAAKGNSAAGDKAKEHATKSRSHAAKAARMARNEATVNELVTNGLLDRASYDTSLAVLNAKPDSNFSDIAPDEDDTTEESDSHDEDGEAAEDGPASDYADKAKKQAKAKGAFTGNNQSPVMNERQWLESAPSYIRDQVVNRRKQLIDLLTVNVADDDAKQLLRREYAAMTTDRLELHAKAVPVRNSQQDNDIYAGVFNRDGLENQFPFVNRITANTDNYNSVEQPPNQPPVYGGFGGGTLPVTNSAVFTDNGPEPPSLIDMIRNEGKNNRNGD